MTAWLRHLPLAVLTSTLALCAALPAHAELQIEITNGVTDPIPIAVVPFTRVPADGGLDVSEVVQRDLASSGRFKTMPRSQMTSTPTRGGDVVASEWKAGGNDYVVVGRVSGTGDGQLAVDFELVNALTGQQLASQRFTGTAAALRNAAHRVSDVVYEKIIGVRGAFATRIAYVSVDGAAAEPALSAHRCGCGWRESAHRSRIALSAHVALVVGRRAVARLRIV
ncbi:MAG: hypothetical protein WDO56_06300 [Gammaproteobacteria bacterium]